MLKTSFVLSKLAISFILNLSEVSLPNVFSSDSLACSTVLKLPSNALLNLFSKSIKCSLVTGLPFLSSLSSLFRPFLSFLTSSVRSKRHCRTKSVNSVLAFEFSGMFLSVLHKRVLRLLTAVFLFVSLSFAPYNPGPSLIPVYCTNIPPFPVLIPSGNDPSPLGNFESLTIPLKRAGRLYLVEARIDGVSGNLVFDTGATGLVLNRTYFRNHLLSDNVLANGITGAAGTINTNTVNRVDISDLYFENIPADVADLGHIENQRAVKIIGLLGFNMIKSFEIVLDASRNELQLNRTDHKGNCLKAALAEPVFDYIQKIEPWHSVLLLKGKIGGKILNFCFDTGAETNAINSHSSRNVLNTITVNRRSNLRGAGSVATEVLFGIMNDFNLDNSPLNGMETIITDLDPLSDAYGVAIDGMLGFNFIQKGIITINLAKKQFGIRFSKAI